MKTQQGTFNDTADLKQNIYYYIYYKVFCYYVHLKSAWRNEILQSNNIVLKL